MLLLFLLFHLFSCKSHFSFFGKWDFLLPSRVQTLFITFENMRIFFAVILFVRIAVFCHLKSMVDIIGQQIGFFILLNGIGSCL